MRGWCSRCHNTGSVDCYCGGDLCVCGGENGDGTDVCPTCDGQPDDVPEDFDDSDDHYDPETMS